MLPTFNSYLSCYLDVHVELSADYYFNYLQNYVNASMSAFDAYFQLLWCYFFWARVSFGHAGRYYSLMNSESPESGCVKTVVTLASSLFLLALGSYPVVHTLAIKRPWKMHVMLSIESCRNATANDEIKSESLSDRLLHTKLCCYLNCCHKQTLWSFEQMLD